VDSEFDEDEIAFPSLRRRVVDATRPENVLRVFREISAHVSQPVRIIVGGSIAVILQGHLTRHTEDIDLVDEVPAELRSQHELLDNIERLYGLRLTHFQSHYLPAGWEQRIGSVGTFGKLQVFAVDVYDVFVGKLFSARIKDRGDLQDMSSRLQQETLLRRVRETTSALRSDARLLDAAKHNWFVLFGEQLPA